MRKIYLGVTMGGSSSKLEKSLPPTFPESERLFGFENVRPRFRATLLCDLRWSMLWPANDLTYPQIPVICPWKSRGEGGLTRNLHPFPAVW